MEKQKYYFIYQTTNKINGKIYVGKHETYDLNDSYLGSGKLLWKAIEKYGIENFERKILFFCENHDELKAKEAEIVNEEFVARKDTYNLKVGGDGGWDFVNKVLTTEERRKHVIDSLTPEQHKFLSDSSKQYWNTISDEERKAKSLKTSESLKEYYKTHTNIWLGKHHTEESKAKISKAHIGKIDGDKNPMAGKHWWKDPNDKTKSLSIKEGDPVPEGWIRGKWITDEQKKNSGKGTKGKIGITDGIHAKFIDSEKDIPKGWHKGIPERSKEAREKMSLSAKEQGKRYREKMTPIMQEKLRPLFECFYSKGFKAVQEKFGYKFTEANLCQQFRKYFPEEYASKKKSHNKFG